MRDLKKVVKIGGACAFLGDTPYATAQLLGVPGINYLIYDYLAEVTLSVLARARAKNPDKGGYAAEFVNIVLRENLAAIAAGGVRIVTDAGGLNPQACAAAARSLISELGLKLKVAVVSGDDILGRVSELGAPEMFTGAQVPAKLMSANAYLGAVPIAQALEMGADIVITGRVSDSALALGPLMHEFGWSEDDYLRMAQGTLAGHLIECGAQVTGGTFTDWFDGADWSDIGYPVIECGADGSMVVTKPAGTGGIVSVGTVSEQLLYEVDDPANYLVGDVNVDLTGVQLRQLGKDRVEVSGVIGRAPTDTYKVCATYQDGYRCIVTLPVVGVDAGAKAWRQARAVLRRSERAAMAKGFEPYRTRHIELLGMEASYGDNARPLSTREVISKIVADHALREPLEILALDSMSPTTSMAPGSTGWHGGRPAVAPMMRVFSFLVHKSEVPARIEMDGEVRTVSHWQGGGEVDRGRALRSPAAGGAAAGAGATRTVRLVDLAWCRSGDKGNRFMLAVIARRPEYLPWISRALSEERVIAFMRHVFDDPAKASIEVFEAPGVHGLNLLFHDALRGGQMASPRLDPLAKAMAQQLLDIDVEIDMGVEVTTHAQRYAAAVAAAPQSADLAIPPAHG
ncbi:DUF1446 domain-containing protein [Alcaligenaceae bacterium]|nr:DUF1446 domain-containing protein [Alcaligenaceae bacterium]